MKVTEYISASENDQVEYLATLKDADKTNFIAIVAWIEEANEAADAQAQALSQLFNCEIKPSVFIVEPLKDLAVAFLRQPDLRQSLKILRLMGSDPDSGYLLTAQTQLVRDADVQAINKSDAQGFASDARFLNLQGEYDIKYTELNVSLIIQVRGMISIMEDQFKKK